MYNNRVIVYFKQAIQYVFSKIGWTKTFVMTIHVCTKKKTFFLRKKLKFWKEQIKGLMIKLTMAMVSAPV